MEETQSVEARADRIVSVWMRIHERLLQESRRLEESKPVRMICCWPEKRYSEERRK